MLIRDLLVFKQYFKDSINYSFNFDLFTAFKVNNY
jgi:hypothetical protein